jgi:hypothetical protein
MMNESNTHTSQNRFLMNDRFNQSDISNLETNTIKTDIIM